jgi:dsDNA-binding SOS-regulon protein
MADIGEPQQSASGDWVLFDGKQKRRFTEKADAEIVKRRLNMASAIALLEKAMLDNVEKAQGLMDGLPKLKRIWTANNVDALITATLPGELVPGSALTVERWAMLAELFDAFGTWLETALPGCGIAPALIVSIQDGEVAA